MKNNPLSPARLDDQGGIPVLHCGDPAHQPLYQRVQRALASARHITVLCGAGISTSAGIPVRKRLDFRSPDGLYNGGRPELPVRISPSELFDVEILRDRDRLRAFGRFMARLRTDARSAEPTTCHAVIAKLFDGGRLRRCYTQNIDGLQTRGRSDMSNTVLELHGSNARLLCHKCGKPSTEDALCLDERLIENGEARCLDCRRNSRSSLSGFLPAKLTRGAPRLEASGTGWEARLRELSPGYMLPDIVYNQDSREHELEGMSLDEMEKADGCADLLLIVGTSVAAEGAAKLARSLANGVHQYGGAVVYIDRGRLTKSKWSGFVDLQLAIDIEKWAGDFFELLDSVVPSDGIGGKVGQRFLAQIGSTSDGRVLCWGQVVALAESLSEQKGDVHGRSRPDLRRVSSGDDRMRGSKTCPRSGRDDPMVEPGRLMFLACHSGSSSSLASSLAMHVALACRERGWEVCKLAEAKVVHSLQVENSAGATWLYYQVQTSCRCKCRSGESECRSDREQADPTTDRDDYELVALHVSDYISLLPCPWRSAGQDQHSSTTQLLEDFVVTLRDLAKRSERSTAVMVCAEGGSKSNGTVSALEACFR
ncbi:hypothetical protein FRC10_004564, partial [Ceratobasidium sp. 414]